MRQRARGRAHLARTGLVWSTSLAERLLTRELEAPMLGVDPSQQGVHPELAEHKSGRCAVRLWL